MEMNDKSKDFVVPYIPPDNWIHYDLFPIINHLVAAHAAILSLKNIPYQRNWADELQIIQLKREVAGTSRIEGADFTERELDAALFESAEQLRTRSQRQAAAAVKTYRWIAQLEDDLPITEEFIKRLHATIIAGADDDHCPPGQLRGTGDNVTFGSPRHRGVEGGSACEKAFSEFCSAIQTEYPRHDPLIRALAVHYHFAAMHPFLDGNGRTARALEALFLQRTGLKDSLFIAMSNYYYDEKDRYLAALAQVRAANHNLTPFLEFGLAGIKLQCDRLFDEIKKNVSKALFRNMMFDLFNRLKSTRQRVLAERQIGMLKLLLDKDYFLDELREKTREAYQNLSWPDKAFIRDINYLLELRAISYNKIENKYRMSIRLEWPTEITETRFFEVIAKLPKARTYSFLP